MRDRRIGNTRVQTPEPERIGVEDIRHDLDAIDEMVAARTEGELRRAAAEARVNDIRNLGGLNLVDEFLRDPYAVIEDPNEELDEAVREAEKEQALVSARALAEGPLLNAYRASVDRHRMEWSRELAEKVPGSLRRITTALKLLRDAEAELDENLGMLSGLAAGDITTRVGGPGTYNVPLSLAIDNAAQALAAATAQLDANRPARGAS